LLRLIANIGSEFSYAIVRQDIKLTCSSNAAGSYDSQPWQQKIIAQVTKEIQSRLSWIGVDWAEEHRPEEAGDDLAARSVRVLDYACGPGTVSRVSMIHLLRATVCPIH